MTISKVKKLKIDLYELENEYAIEVISNQETTSFWIYHKETETKLHMFTIFTKDIQKEDIPNLIEANANDYIKIHKEKIQRGA